MAKSLNKKSVIVRASNDNDCFNGKIRFNAFSIGHGIVNYINISWISFSYKSDKYTEGERVFKLMARQCGPRLYLHCLQMIFLFSWITRTAYNGFFNTSTIPEKTTLRSTNLTRTVPDSIDQEIGISVTSFIQLARQFWQAIGAVLIDDHWKVVRVHRRLINILTFIFTANSFFPKFHYLLRKHKPWLNHEQSAYDLKLRQFSSMSTVQSDEYISYRDFLTEPKLTLKETGRFCLSKRAFLNDQLAKKYPILNEMTHQNILRFDLMEIKHKGGLLCCAATYRSLSTYTICSLFLVPLSAIAVCFLSACLIHHYEPIQISTLAQFLNECLKNISVLLVTICNVSTFADSTLVLVFSLVLSDRLAIYNIQLDKFISECRAINKSLTSYYDYKTSFKLVPPNKLQHGTIKDMVNLKRRCYSVAKIDYSTVRSDLRMDDNCVRLIKVLHQLLFEFKQIKDQFKTNTDMDLFIRLCTLTWIVSTAIIVQSCSSCESKIFIYNILISFMAIGYLISIVIQLFFPAKLSQQVILILF